MISITYRDGLVIRSILSSSSNTSATISSDGECTVLSYVLFLDNTLSFGEYALILTLVTLFSQFTKSIFLMMWSGLGFVNLLHWISSVVKTFRRHRFVKQIRLKKYRKRFCYFLFFICSHRQLIENQPICSICLTEFERDVFLKELRCGHFFHSECIDPWLLNEKAVCPVCRRGMYDVDEWVLISICVLL